MRPHTDPITIYGIICRAMAGELSEGDKKALDGWLAEDPRHERIYSRAMSGEVPTEAYGRYREASAAERWRSITERIALQRRRRLMRRVAWAAAACIALIGGVGVWMWTGAGKEQQTAAADYPHIRPGSNKAVLVLDSGEQIPIEEPSAGQNRRLAMLGIAQGEDNALSYTPEAEATMHTLYVPRGGICNIVLSDGTRVCLNSDSRLRYPGTFTGTRRHVELEGEAFFEVASAAGMPFTVAAGGVDIRVTGTRFNVMAYAGRGRVETTLVEGSVELAAAGLTEALTPGTQAVYFTGTKILDCRTVDALQYTRWKDGVFEFNELPLEDITYRLGLWYDVDFAFAQQSTKQILFTGAFDKQNDLTYFLDLIKKTDAIDYRIEGRTVTLTKK